MSTTATKKDYVLLSKRGMRELKESIAQLERDRNRIRKQLQDANKSSSRDDRLQRNEMLSNLEATESELVEKRILLSKSKLLPSKRARMKVAIGSVVDLIDQQGRLFRYTIVESIEANPSDGRISAESPLGSSLLGKAARDVVEWSVGNRSNSLQLVRVQ